MQEVLNKFKSIVGSEHVISSPEALAAYSQNTFGDPTEVGAVVRPQNTQEVAQIVRAANESATQIYPISCGKNWGYGNASPCTPGQITLDLSRMNKVVEVNSDFDYAVIEPGVTQKELSDYLGANDLPYWLDTNGAGPNVSIVGNILERGFGHSNLSDRFAHSCNYEIVLPNGDIIQTGFGAGSPTKTENLYKYGIGPTIDGIFTQSNFGIITRMTISLIPKPEKLLVYALKIPDTDNMEKLIEKLRVLKQQGALPSALHFGNDLRVLSSKIRRNAFQGDLSEEARLLMAKEHEIGMWGAVGGFYGTKPVVAGCRKSLKKATKGLCTTYFLDEQRISFVKRGIGFLPDNPVSRIINIMLGKIEPIFRLLKGVPSNDYLKGVYWGIDGDEPADHVPNPDDPNIGLYWVSPLFPATGKDFRLVQRIIETTFEKYGFDPLITYTMVSGNSLQGIISIHFDKSKPAEVKSAKQCYDETTANLQAQGCLPYRLGTITMDKIKFQHPEYRRFLQTIKKAIDPKGIIAPGRYEFTDDL